MAKLGKFVKGRTKKTEEKKRVMIKIRHQEKQIEDLTSEQKLMKLKREWLKKEQQEEEKTANFNWLKILNHWRRIMRVAKTESLKKEMKIYQQNHERVVDCKEAIIQMLDRDLEEAET